MRQQSWNAHLVLLNKSNGSVIPICRSSKFDLDLAKYTNWCYFTRTKLYCPAQWLGYMNTKHVHARSPLHLSHATLNKSNPGSHFSIPDILGIGRPQLAVAPNIMIEASSGTCPIIKTHKTFWSKAYLGRIGGKSYTKHILAGPNTFVPMQMKIAYWARDQKAHRPSFRNENLVRRYDTSVVEILYCIEPSCPCFVRRGPGHVPSQR